MCSQDPIITLLGDEADDEDIVVFFVEEVKAFLARTVDVATVSQGISEFLADYDLFPDNNTIETALRKSFYYKTAVQTDPKN